MLEAAYDDAAGVTAEFNRNVLQRAQPRARRRLRPRRRSSTSRSSTAEREWIEMRLRAQRAACACASRRSTSTSSFAAARGAAHRDQREVHAASAWRGDFAAAGLELERLAHRRRRAVRAVAVDAGGLR